MNSLLQDLRFALRQMRRSPGFATTAVLILALGIAANVIVFGVLQAMILRPLDVPNPDRVMTFAPRVAGYPIFSYPEVRDVRDGNTVFSAVAALNIDVFGLEANGTTRPVWRYEVSGQYFEVVAIKPYLGRLLERADDDHPGASDAVVLSWPAWKTHFGSDPNIVGKTVRLNKPPGRESPEHWRFSHPGFRRPHVVPGTTPNMFFMLSVTSDQRWVLLFGIDTKKSASSTVRGSPRHFMHI